MLLDHSSATARRARICGHYALQGHSGSPTLVPSESSYTASYYRITNNLRSISHSCQFIVQYELVKCSLSAEGCFSLTHCFSVISANFTIAHIIASKQHSLCSTFVAEGIALTLITLT